MLSIVKVTDAYWQNDDHSRLFCQVVYEDGESDQLSISVGENSQYWARIEPLLDIDEVDANTVRVQNIIKQQDQMNSHVAQEKEMHTRHNALYNAKIEAFSLPEVTNASVERKSQVRKAKNVTEVFARVALCIMEAENASTNQG